MAAVGGNKINKYTLTMDVLLTLGALEVCLHFYFKIDFLNQNTDDSVEADPVVPSPSTFNCTICRDCSPLVDDEDDDNEDKAVPESKAEEKPAANTESPLETTDAPKNGRYAVSVFGCVSTLFWQTGFVSSYSS